MYSMTGDDVRPGFDQGFDFGFEFNSLSVREVGETEVRGINYSIVVDVVANAIKNTR